MEKDSDHDLLIKVNTKLDILLSDHQETKARLTKLEGWQGKLIGISAFAGALMISAVNKVFNL